MQKRTDHRILTKKGVTVVIILFFIFLNPLLTLNGYAGDEPLAPTSNDSFWLWHFLGHLHPMAVHFPVSLILFAAILEVFTLKKFNSKLRPGINLLVVAGVAAAFISAVLGLLLAKDGDYGESLLSLHQWMGITTACLGAVTLFFLSRILLSKKRLNSVKMYRGVLFFTAITVSAAGHFGALLTHGSDYLTSAFPWSEDYEVKTVSNFDFVSLKNNTRLNKNQEMELSKQVKSIFAHNCYKCHGAEKIKGELRLDSKKMIFKGGEDGPVIVPGDPGKSELYRRITLPRTDKEAMPSKGQKLSDEDIAVINIWIEKGAPWPESDKSVYRIAKLEPRNPQLPPEIDNQQNPDNVSLEGVLANTRIPPAENNQRNPIDLWTNAYFKKNSTNWRLPVDDRTYLRRIYLDIIGLLPTPEDLNRFATDKRPGKRALWVRQLLNRNDDYAMHWFSFWNDALRNDYTGTGYITGGRYNISDWLYKSLQSNKPYDLFVKELVSPDESSKGFIEGIKWRGVVNASQRTEMQAAQNVGQVFFGLNLKCASCHNSFISDWKLEDAYAFANIFADSSLEISRCEKPTGKYTVSRMLWKELGYIDSVAPAAVKQKQLAELMTKPQNGRFARTIVNRIWAQVMGRGLVEPVDMMDNEPWSQDLLDWMAFNFVQNKYDMKELIYLITTSLTYQQPSVGFKDQNNIIVKDYKFKGMLRRRMSAEQFADAVSSIIGPIFPDSLVKYNPFGSPVAEKPVAAKPADKKSDVNKPAAEKKSEAKKPVEKSPAELAAEKLAAEKRAAAKLIAKKLAEEKAGADRLIAERLVAEKVILLYPRASLVVNNSFLTALGRPNRETVSTGRESQANLLQALELTNGARFNEVLKKGALQYKQKYRSTDLIIRNIYLRALGREPEENELKVARQAITTSPGMEAGKQVGGYPPSVEGIQDLLWAIMLLPEFQIIY